jgi:molybdopterin molybdotransferase
MSLIKVDEAREIILSRIQFMGTEKIPLTETLGRVLCEDIIARRNNPPMDNSAMDGYALIAEDVKTASPEIPLLCRSSAKSPPVIPRQARL